ncbi:oligopeptide transporter 7 [Perilla frutescens var. hirtella]|nr:oligopeptide transporter 7 [Perilla frutescens var. hirtella]KAH6807351.1 oligopeptide transporter 7 [Perilla frutescens var. frutescens]
MATLFRRLATAALIAFGGQTKSVSGVRFGALAAIFGGISIYYFYSSPNVLNGFSVDWWGNGVDGCPLASCPTAKGIFVDGCPVH